MILQSLLIRLKGSNQDSVPLLLRLKISNQNSVHMMIRLKGSNSGICTPGESEPERAIKPGVISLIHVFTEKDHGAGRSLTRHRGRARSRTPESCDSCLARSPWVPRLTPGQCPRRGTRPEQPPARPQMIRPAAARRTGQPRGP